MHDLLEVHHRLGNKLPQKLININSIIFCSKARAHFNLSSLIPIGFILLRICQIKTLECITDFPQGEKEQTTLDRQTSHPLIQCREEFRQLCAWKLQNLYSTVPKRFPAQQNSRFAGAPLCSLFLLLTSTVKTLASLLSQQQTTRLSNQNWTIFSLNTVPEVLPPKYSVMENSKSSSPRYSQLTYHFKDDAKAERAWKVPTLPLHDRLLHQTLPLFLRGIHAVISRWSN